jgi:hypothetical protein
VLGFIENEIVVPKSFQQGPPPIKILNTLFSQPLFIFCLVAIQSYCSPFVLPAACHSVALGADGRCYTWGRNEVQI